VLLPCLLLCCTLLPTYLLPCLLSCHANSVAIAYVLFVQVKDIDHPHCVVHIAGEEVESNLCVTRHRG